VALDGLVVNMVEGLRACFADGVRLLFDIDVLDYRPSLNKATATGGRPMLDWNEDQ
jgi:hypothetical protein